MCQRQSQIVRNACPLCVPPTAPPVVSYCFVGYAENASIEATRSPSAAGSANDGGIPGKIAPRDRNMSPRCRPECGELSSKSIVDIPGERFDRLLEVT
jgi:hypothetical protein